MSAHAGQSQKFFPDDPLAAMPEPTNVKAVSVDKVDAVYDLLANSKASSSDLATTRAGAINTLGEVPDSEWFTNRHGRVRMSREDLQQGLPRSRPTPPYEVIGGKNDGIMPGFRLQDSQGRRYFVKGDPVDYPELATAAEVIVSRFLYAIGYNTPKNDLVDLKTSDLRLADKAKIGLPNGHSRDMTWYDIEDFFRQIARNPDGSYRVVASLAIEGESVGPFRYNGTRTDDPNDITAHEDRRDLRGLYVFSAWLNNTDMKAQNTLDTIVEENGRRFIRHHLIDFGSALGSDGDAPKDARFGNRYMLGSPLSALTEALTLGVIPKGFELIDYPKLRGIGNFESAAFRPDKWVSDYPNPAFLRRLPDDDFWGAKQVMAFTDDDIQAIVETGQFSYPSSTDYMIRTLEERRNKIGRLFFARVLPLDRFRVQNSELLFDDLAVRYSFRAPRRYSVQWSQFNNLDWTLTTIRGADSARLPQEALQASIGSYFCAQFGAADEPQKTVAVYIRKEPTDFKVVGIDRNW
jgi:hypothetical protein